MDYEVILTTDAENDLNEFLEYLLFEKQSEQAAKNLLDDFEQTMQTLQMVAGSLKDCENPRLRERGYKRIDFISHRYFMLYRIEGNKAIIDSIFHELQDYENRIN
ncbi:MAG TPA: type II toxin-antitoxin system RelE/ParE family toxin [Candidatus Mediterraneibacter faecavium]|uniref:Type II toxin-antitoxin system RelE/ParE family toxin n=1 Tax=Candidatus Mediterraneibacter faecavium TaxID=2838668 RepID=A0A9D2QAH4_9FIRM|nr:type II toxin-antitoxin system RelE/ParE family toxin [Candidatus Mediterraneibacter faecavium]